ncbi:MAG: alpha/beta fold hydrolase [Pseudomonadales bacterium]
MSWKSRILVMFLIALGAAAIWLLERDQPIAAVDAKYSNAQSQFLTLADQSRVHFRDQGRADGLPLVLVHGSNASLHTWELWVAELGETYRVVTVDMPGHGLTGRTPVDDYSTDAFVAVVKALAEHLALPPFVLGGNSMGGRVAWSYALAHPRDVRGLLLLNASGPRAWYEDIQAAEAQASDAEEQEKPSAPLAFSLLRKPWFSAVARYVDPYYLVAQGLRSAHYDSAVVTDALIDRYYDLSMRAGTRTATLKRFGTQRSVKAVDLGQLTMPVLIQWGVHDAVIPVAVGERFAVELPDAELIIYQDVGHIPMEEVPVQSAADAARFINGRIPGQTLEMLSE